MGPNYKIIRLDPMETMVTDTYQQSQHKIVAMSVAEVARRLGVSVWTVYREIDDGVLPHMRVRRRITITPQQLDQYQNRSQGSAASFEHLQ